MQNWNTVSFKPGILMRPTSEIVQTIESIFLRSLKVSIKEFLQIN